MKALLSRKALALSILLAYLFSMYTSAAFSSESVIYGTALIVLIICYSTYLASRPYVSWVDSFSIISLHVLSIVFGLTTGLFINAAQTTSLIAYVASTSTIALTCIIIAAVRLSKLK
ncbi:MAG: hypothetical protein RMI83_03800 [Desulfurococcaceae archaeon]|nr:hypothetical protein [Sulfolobales archaeon]MDW8170211.1 hypothetical protein [Desulfurococcaceae archaeon]